MFVLFNKSPSVHSPRLLCAVKFESTIFKFQVSENEENRLSAVEMFSQVVDTSPYLVRDFIMKEGQTEEEVCINFERITMLLMLLADEVCWCTLTTLISFSLYIFCLICI